MNGEDQKSAKHTDVANDKTDEKPLRIRDLLTVATELRKEAEHKDKKTEQEDEQPLRSQDIMDLEFTI